MKIVWVGGSGDSGTSNRIARAVNRMGGSLDLGAKSWDPNH